MAAKRLSMRKLKEVLRLRALGHSDRSIASSLDVGRSTVRRYRMRAEEAGLDWPEASELAESEIKAQLFPPAEPPPEGPRQLPDWEWVLTASEHFPEVAAENVPLRWIESVSGAEVGDA